MLETRIPEWADAQLSRDLPTLTQKGEGPHLEFKAQFPEQAHDLAKEIAAFATSGGGRVLVGVDDGGKIIGLFGMNEPAQRDEISRRVGGVARTKVKPAVSPMIAFAVNGTHIVMCISVPPGQDPVYYYDGRPYIRQMTESRPAEPHEVMELFRRWFGVCPAGATAAVDTPDYVWRDVLDQILTAIIIVTDEFEDRMGTEGRIDLFGNYCDNWAQALRDVVHEYLEGEDYVAESLRQLAHTCDEIVGLVRPLSSATFPTLEELAPSLHSSASRLKAELIVRPTMNEAEAQATRSALKTVARRARDLVIRLPSFIDSYRIEDMKQNASQIGEELLLQAYGSLPFLSDSDLQVLREAGRQLHLADAHVLYPDGGKSFEALKARIIGATEKCEQVIACL